MSLLEMGSTGPEVTQLQEKLVEFGYFVGEVDGVYGRKTAAAVAYLQSTHGLDIDAIAGPQVRQILDIGERRGNVLRVAWPYEDEYSVDDVLLVELEIAREIVSSVTARVVMWFRGPGGDDNTEGTVTVEAGTSAVVGLRLPASIADHAGEVYFTGFVFDLAGDHLADEGTGSFRVIPARSS